MKGVDITMLTEEMLAWMHEIEKETEKADKKEMEYFDWLCKQLEDYKAKKGS
jgi:hypothetical protein